MTIDAAYFISGIDQERVTALDVVRRAVSSPADIGTIDLEWLSLSSYAYFTGPPLSSYWEPAYVEYRQGLRAIFTAQRLLSTIRQRPEILDGMLRAESLAFEIAQEDLSQHPDAIAVRRHLRQWYLELCDQIHKPLLALPTFGLRKQVPKGPLPNLFNLIEALEAGGWTTVREGYNPTVRNGLAHELRFETEHAGSKLVAVLADKKGNQERRTAQDLKDDVEMMLDRALGYSLALRVELLLHADLTRATIGPEYVPADTRERSLLRHVPDHLRVRPESATLDSVAGRWQLTVEALDRSRDPAERFVHLVPLLVTAATWFPDAQTVIVGLKGAKRWRSWVRTRGDELRRWVAGQISDEEFVRRSEFTLFPFRRPLGGLRMRLSFFVRKFKEEYRRRADSAQSKRVRYRFLSIEDTSHAAARRYRAEAVLMETPTERVIRDCMLDAVSQLKGRVVHRSDHARRTWGRRGPHYVSLFLYSREKRPRDRFAWPSSGYYLGRAEYSDPTFQGTLPTSKLAVQADDGVSFEVARGWSASLLPPIELGP